MRTYAAFSLLALASSNALAAPASPDLGHEISAFPSSAPNSPDLSRGSDSPAFPSLPPVELDAPSVAPPLPTKIHQPQGPRFARTTGLAARDLYPYREYEAWLQQHKVNKRQLQKDPAGQPELDGSREFQNELLQDDSPRSATQEEPTTDDSTEQDKMPKIPGVEQMNPLRGFLAERQLGAAAINQTLSDVKSTKPGMKKQGPARLEQVKRDIVSMLDDQLRSNQIGIPEPTIAPSAAPSAVPTAKPRRVADLTRMMRRAPEPIPGDDLVLHSNGVVESLLKPVQSLNLASEPLAKSQS